MVIGCCVVMHALCEIGNARKCADIEQMKMHDRDPMLMKVADVERKAVELWDDAGV